MRGVSLRKLLPVLTRNTRKVKVHAVNSTSGNSHCGGCTPVAGESLHPYAVNHQVHRERRGGDCAGFMDSECFWSVPRLFRHPHRQRMTCERGSLEEQAPRNSSL